MFRNHASSIWLSGGWEARGTCSTCIWVHMRKSNTEPIIRVYAEAGARDVADELGQRFMAELLET